MEQILRKYVTDRGGIYIQHLDLADDGTIKKETWEKGKADQFLIDASYVSFMKAKDIAFCYEKNKGKIKDKNKVQAFECKLMKVAKEENYKGDGGLILYLDILEGLGHSSPVKKIVPPF